MGAAAHMAVGFASARRAIPAFHLCADQPCEGPLLATSGALLQHRIQGFTEENSCIFDDRQLLDHAGTLRVGGG